MLEKTVAELSKALRSREVSSVELTQAYLEKIATVNERLNTYITTENIHYTSLNAVLVGTRRPSCECVNVSVAKYEL